MFARGLAALTVAAIFIAGCGTPGPPLPPSLDLPRPVADLAVTRMGDQVEANFTLPDENTDHLAFKRLGAVVLQQCAQRSSDCVALQSWKAGEFKPGARVTWKGALPQRPYVTVVANNDRGRNAGAGNVDHFALCQRLDGVVHLLQDENMQVAKIAGKQISKDLAFPIPCHLRATRKAGDDEMDIGGPISLANYVVPRLNDANTVNDAVD